MQVLAPILRSVKRLAGYTRFILSGSRSGGRDLRVEADEDTVRDALGDAFFTNGWELSWHYKGEDMNMRRPLRLDDQYEWYQTHVRGYVDDDGTVYLEAHEDLEPTEYPYWHLYPPEDAARNQRRALADVAEVLDDNGIEYRKI